MQITQKTQLQPLTSRYYELMLCLGEVTCFLLLLTNSLGYNISQHFQMEESSPIKDFASVRSFGDITVCETCCIFGNMLKEITVLGV